MSSALPVGLVQVFPRSELERNQGERMKLLADRHNPSGSGARSCPALGVPRDAIPPRYFPVPPPTLGNIREGVNSPIELGRLMERECNINLL